MAFGQWSWLVLTSHEAITKGHYHLNSLLDSFLNSLLARLYPFTLRSRASPPAALLMSAGLLSCRLSLPTSENADDSRNDGVPARSCRKRSRALCCTTPRGARAAAARRASARPAGSPANTAPAGKASCGQSLCPTIGAASPPPGAPAPPQRSLPSATGGRTIRVFAQAPP